MRHQPSRSLFCFFCLILFAGCASTPLPDLNHEERAAVEQQVRDFLGKYRAAIESRQIEALRALYVNDDRFAWFEDGSERYSTPNDVVQALSALPQNMSLHTEYSGTRVLVLSRDLAMVRSSFQTRLGEAGQEGFSFGGAMTMLVERDPEGWKIVSGHTSTARPRQ